MYSTCIRKIINSHLLNFAQDRLYFKDFASLKIHKNSIISTNFLHKISSQQSLTKYLVYYDLRPKFGST